MKFRILLFIALTSNVLLSQSNTQNPLELWVLPQENNAVKTAHKFASKNWNFEVKVLDSEFAEMMKDSIEPHNESLWKQLENDGIANAKEKYQDVFEKEKEPLQQAVDISLSQGYVIGIYKKIQSQKREEKTEIQQVTKTEYRFMIYSCEKNKPEKLEARFIVNIKDKTIRIFK